MAICKFIHKINSNKPIEIYGDGSSVRDYTYIEDIIRPLYSCINVNTGNFQIINIGNSDPIKLKNLVSVIENCLGKKAQINYLPTQNGDVPRTHADISKAKKLFGYTPSVSLKQGIEKYIKYLKLHE